MKRWIAIALLLLLVPAVAIGWFFWRSGMESSPRRNWKNAAVAEIETRVMDPEWVAAEMARIESQPSHFRQKSWFSDEVIVAGNGEWMVCRSICNKEEGSIPDLFVGRGSDAQWYYSTFHFCIAKDVLHNDPQPRTLADFVHGYWLEPFDGRSDDSLKPTWTGGPYGPERPR